VPHVAGDEYETQIEVLGGDFYGGDWGPYVAPGNPFTVGQFYNPVSEPSIAVPPPLIFPTVTVTPPATSQGEGDSATPGPEALPPSVVDPEANQTTTVYEDVPGGIYETTRAETDWDAVYDAYVILNPEVEEDVPFHQEIIDWGTTIIGGIAGGILDPVGIGAAIQNRYLAEQPYVGTVTGIPSLGQQTSLTPAPVTAVGGTMPAGCPPHGPKYAKICLATNVITPLRRRRRRRLLTSSDIKDLSALKSIVGGAALQAAVTQAVRR